MELALVTLLVKDYDEAVAYYCGVLGFRLIEDAPLTAEKRWIVVAPPGGGARLLLAKAVGAEQCAAVGRQAGGRVGFFLHTEDFAETCARFADKGVHFCEAPRTEVYGKVVVFADLYGNRWDLIEPA